MVEQVQEDLEKVSVTIVIDGNAATSKIDVKNRMILVVIVIKAIKGEVIEEEKSVIEVYLYSNVFDSVIWVTIKVDAQIILQVMVQNFHQEVLKILLHKNARGDFKDLLRIVEAMIMLNEVIKNLLIFKVDMIIEVLVQKDLENV